MFIIRPRGSNLLRRYGLCYRRSSVTIVRPLRPAKTAEPIEIPFAAVDSGGPKEQCRPIRRGSRAPHAKGNFLGEGLAGLAHVRTFPRVDILKATQQSGMWHRGSTGSQVRCRCRRLGYTRWCWRHLENTIEPSTCCSDAPPNYFDHLLKHGLPGSKCHFGSKPAQLNW